MGARISIIASGVLALLATGAHAADAIVPETPLAPAAPIATDFNWSGAYIGGQVGYGWASSKLLVDPAAAFKGNMGGFLGGVYAGYNFDTGTNVILGVDGDFTGTSVGETIAHGDLASAKTRLRWSGAARARVGYAFDRFLPYIAGGAAFGNIGDKAHILGTRLISQSKTQTGWTVGGGVDYAVTDNIVTRFEYRYTDFGKRNLDLAVPGLKANEKMNSNDIRLGVAYKF
ncbi:outer membrane immunogenic protein [Ochrobactrum sp. 19YEA23]|uniref:outer membrane protein n=1 Tax=Ochrobactrum sp. 19YEA23 TaxID=3039854 RepID=UPI002479160B|nr:outer membrane immunogenic protein [Ochrobactrum sp. 19YEA23]